MSFDYTSESWSITREWVLSMWDGACERCGDTDEDYFPHVHHTYGTNVDKFEVLCPTCHSEHHGDPEIATVGWKNNISNYGTVPITNNKFVCTHDYTDNSYLKKGNKSLEDYYG